MQCLFDNYELQRLPETRGRKFRLRVAMPTNYSFANCFNQRVGATMLEDM